METNSDSKRKISGKTIKIAESFFGTQHDPEQIPINKESHEKLLSLNKNSVLYELDEKGEPVSWVIVIPTTEILMKDFLSSKINEKELFDMTKPGEKYDSLYFCSAFTVPEFRNKGLALKLAESAIRKISGDRSMNIFSWAYSPEGTGLIKKLEDKLGVKILLKKQNTWQSPVKNQ